MNEKITAVVTGAVGAGATEVVQQIPIEQIPALGNLIIQVIIGIAAIWKMLKKPKTEAPADPQHPMRKV